MPGGLFKPRARCLKASYGCRETWFFGSSPLLSRRSWRHGALFVVGLINTFVATGPAYCVIPTARPGFCPRAPRVPKIHFECRERAEAVFAAVFRPFFAERGAARRQQPPIAPPGAGLRGLSFVVRNLPVPRDVAMASDTSPTMSQLTRQLAADEQQISLGGGKQAIERQRAKKRLFVRDRLKLLLEEKTPWLVLGLWSG